MSNSFFAFKQFTVFHDQCAMKVGTDGILLGAWTSVKEAARICDVGTGTGLVALMLAQRSDAVIDAVEIDAAAAAQAASNVQGSPWSYRITIRHLSFQHFAAQKQQVYDLIVSNPPYFQQDLLPPGKDRQRARHARDLTYRELIVHSAGMLGEAGRMSVILPHDHAGDFMAEAYFNGLYLMRRMLVLPLPERKPVRQILELGRCRISDPPETRLVIRDGNGSYSGEYTALTKDFYL